MRIEVGEFVIEVEVFESDGEEDVVSECVRGEGSSGSETIRALGNEVALRHEVYEDIIRMWLNDLWV